MRAILVAAIAGLASTAAQAQVREVMVIPQHQEKVVQFSEPFSSASVGDPKLVDVLPKSDRVIVLQGKLPGLTDVLTFVDGHVQRHITVVVQPLVAGEAGRVVLMHNQKKLSNLDAGRLKSDLRPLPGRRHPPGPRRRGRRTPGAVGAEAAAGAAPTLTL